MKLQSAAQRIALIFAMLVSMNAHAASAGQKNSDEKSTPPTIDANSSAAKSESGNNAKAPSVEDRVQALERLIEQQQREIQSLRAVIEKRDADAPASQPASPL